MNEIIIRNGLKVALEKQTPKVVYVYEASEKEAKNDKKRFGVK